MADLQPAVSPRIAALQQALENGDASALDRFWHAITQEGAPLVERIPGDDQHELVTILWRAADPTQNVVVMTELEVFEPAQNQMTRLLETDLWYRSYRARSDTRTTYQLAPNDSLAALANVKDWRERTATWRPDPLNPRTFGVGTVMSVIELADAPPQPWVAPRPGTPAGELQTHTFRSTVLHNERNISVYLPPGFHVDAEPYGMLVLFDGYSYTQLIPTPTILDNLISERRIPPLIALIIWNPDQETRNRELPCFPPFIDFLTDELLPWGRERYHINSDPTKTVVAGSSYGGLAASFAGLCRPDVFGNVLSQSGAFAWKPERETEHEWLARQFVAGRTLPLRFYLDAGRLETATLGDQGPSLLLSNRHMRDVLQAKGYALHYIEFSGGHTYLCWRGTLADGLLALIGK